MIVSLIAALLHWQAHHLKVLNIIVGHSVDNPMAIPMANLRTRRENKRVTRWHCSNSKLEIGVPVQDVVFRVASPCHPASLLCGQGTS
jgi:hypothetical protein